MQTDEDGDGDSESGEEEEEEEESALALPALSDFLRQHNLPSAYLGILAESGFEDTYDIISMRKGELGAVSGIKRGHARKLERAARKLRKELKK